MSQRKKFENKKPVSITETGFLVPARKNFVKKFGRLKFTAVSLGHQNGKTPSPPQNPIFKMSTLTTTGQALDTFLGNQRLFGVTSTLSLSQFEAKVSELETELALSRTMAASKATQYFSNLQTAHLTAQGATVVSVSLDFRTTYTDLVECEVTATFFVAKPRKYPTQEAVYFIWE